MGSLLGLTVIEAVKRVEIVQQANNEMRNAEIIETLFHVFSFTPVVFLLAGEKKMASNLRRTRFLLLSVGRKSSFYCGASLQAISTTRSISCTLENVDLSDEEQWFTSSSNSGELLDTFSVILHAITLLAKRQMTHLSYSLLNCLYY